MKNNIQDIKSIVDDIKDEIIQIRRNIHQNPELSQKEFETSALIVETLKAYGIEAKTIDGGIGATALIEGGNPGKTLALRADIDALPIQETTALAFKSVKQGVMHACGHDIHTTVLLGTAIVLNKIKASLHGNVRLIFQPNEEGLGGAQSVIKNGVLDSPKVDFIAAMHSWPFIDAGKMGLKSGPMMAAASNVNIKVTGKSGHAAHPHKSVDPVVIMSSIIMNLQTLVSRSTDPIDSAVLTFGRISGGTARNIIPNEVICEGTCRTLSQEVNDAMGEKIKSMASHIAESFGGSCEVEYIRECPPVVNNEGLYQNALEALTNMLGSDQIVSLASPSMGSEDLAFYFEKVPGILMRLGTGNDSPESRIGLHNSGVIFDDEKAIPTGIQAFTAFAVKMLS